MSSFKIDDQIDKLLENFLERFNIDIEELKSNIKKCVLQSEKSVLKKYIKLHEKSSGNEVNKITKRNHKRIPKREQDYSYVSNSDSDSERSK
jgi:hypothetical protein